MPIALLIFLVLVGVPSLAVILFGVYVDHTRRRRRQASIDFRRTLADRGRRRSESLKVVGGSFRDTVPEHHLGKTRLP